MWNELNPMARLGKLFGGFDPNGVVETALADATTKLTVDEVTFACVDDCIRRILARTIRDQGHEEESSRLFELPPIETASDASVALSALDHGVKALPASLSPLLRAARAPARHAPRLSPTLHGVGLFLRRAEEQGVRLLGDAIIPMASHMFRGTFGHSEAEVPLTKGKGWLTAYSEGARWSVEAPLGSQRGAIATSRDAGPP